MKKNLFLIGLLLLLSFAQRADAAFFSDVPPEHENFVAITYLSEEGVLNGFSDGTFKPDQKVNRAEALKILILGSGLTAEDEPNRDPFPDVEKDAWYAPYVSEAKDLGVVQGTAEGYFEPTRTVNKAEALKMLILVNGIELSEPTKSPYLDISLDDWFVAYFSFAKTHDFFDDPSYAEPAKELTRGELAEIFYRLEMWKQNPHPDEGQASYLSDSFDGHGTASGETFDQDAYTGAHQTFAFGSKILVTNKNNNKSVIVKINDRGPYAESRIIDLTSTAFEAIDSLSKGIASVRLKELPSDTEVGIPTNEICGLVGTNTAISKNYFDDITLNQNLPDHFRKNEIYTISGKITGTSASEASLFVGEKDYTVAVSNNQFSFEVVFPEAGNFDLAMIPGTSGTSNIANITVVDSICEPSFDEQSASTPQDLTIENIEGKAVLSWQDDWNDIFRVRFSQGTKTVTFFVNGTTSFTPPSSLFQDFDEGLTEVEISGAPLANSSSISQNKRFSESIDKSIFITTQNERTVDQEVSNLSLPDYYTVNNTIVVSSKTSQALRENATILSPTGEIFDVPLEINSSSFRLSFVPDAVGVYIVEINNEGGIAVVNAPIVHKGLVPLLPDYRATLSDDFQDVNLERDRRILINLINSARVNAGLDKITLDDNLNNLAQFRADDMVDRDYFAHTDPSGKTVVDYQVKYGVNTSISENIAMDANLQLAHEGLMRSPIHRRNILGETWQNVGLGITKRESGEIIVVEVFSEEAMDSDNLDSYREQVLEKINSMRDEPLVLSTNLNAVAQDWATKMSDEDFFDFEASDGSSLQENLSESGIDESASALIYQASQFSSLLDLLNVDDENSSLLVEKNWEKVGIGLKANNVGDISATIIVSE